MSGLAMQAMKSSRLASGAGHQFFHVWEMECPGLDWQSPLSHGFKVRVGTVASCTMWQLALTMDFADLDNDRIVALAEDRGRGRPSFALQESAGRHTARSSGNDRTDADDSLPLHHPRSRPRRRDLRPDRRSVVLGAGVLRAASSLGELLRSAGRHHTTGSFPTRRRVMI